MKRDYSMDFSYGELQTLQESLEFTEMMSDVDGVTPLKDRVESYIYNIEVNLASQKS